MTDEEAAILESSLKKANLNKGLLAMETNHTSRLSWLNQSLVYVSSRDVPEQFTFLHLVISQMEWNKFHRKVYMR